MNNNDIYNNYNGSSLGSALSKLNQAKETRQQVLQEQQLQYEQEQIQQEQQRQKSEENWFTRFFGTLDEIRYNFETGFFNFVEGAVDAVLSVGAVFDQEWAENAIKFDISDKIMDFRNNYLSENAIYKAATGKNLYDQSYLNDASEKVQEIVTGIEQGLGQMIGTMGLGLFNPTAGLIASGVSATGSTIESTISSPDYTGDFGKAALYGIASGATEALVEKYVSAGTGKLLNGIAKKTGIKWLENNMGIFTGDYSGNNLGKNIVTAISQAVSEGGEEVVTELADPLIRTIYSGESVSESYKNNLSKEDLEMAFITGLGASLAFGSANVGMKHVSDSITYGKDAEGNSNVDNYQEANEIVKELKENENNQQSMSENDYNSKKVSLLQRLANIGRRINGTLNAKKRANTTKMVTDLINSVKSGTTNKIGLNGQLTDGDIELISNEFNFDTDTVNRLDKATKAINEANPDTKINVNLVASDEELKTPDGKRFVNAQYNKDTNTITFSKRISPNIAFNDLVAHELFHHFNTNPDLKGVVKDIKTHLESTGQYDDIKKDIANKYSASDLDEEVISHYIGGLFKKNQDFSQMFTSRSKVQKIIDHLRKIRKNTTDEYIRARYADAISKLVNAKEFKSNNLVGVMYSLKELNLKDLNKDQQNRIKLKSEIEVEVNSIQELEMYIEDALENRKIQKNLYLGNIDNQTLLKIEDDIDNNIFKENKKYSLAINYDHIRHIQKHFKTKNEIIKIISKLADIINNYDNVEFIKGKIENKLHFIKNYNNKIYSNFNVLSNKSSAIFLQTLYIEKTLIVGNEKRSGNIQPANVTKTLAHTPKAVLVSDTSSKDIINNDSEKSNTKYSVGEKIENSTALEIANTSKQIQKQITKAQEFVKDNKQYQEDTIKAIKQLVDNDIKNINHTKRGSKDINKDARTVLTNLRGDKFLQNKFILEVEAINPEQKAYLETAFSFFEKRIETLNYKGRKTIPALDYATNINDMDGYDEYADVFEGKTEGDVVLSTLRVINKVLNSASNEMVELNGYEVNRKAVTQEEVFQQIKAGRSETKAQKGLLKSINQLATSVVDGDAMFDIWGRYNENSLMNKMYAELYQSHLNYLKVKREYQEDVDKFIENNKKFFRKLKDKKQKVKIAGHDVYYGEAISLYMALEADNAPEHLLKADRSGAVLTGNKGRRITIEQNEFLNMLTDEQRKKLKDTTIKGKDRKTLYRECGDTIRAEIGKVIGQDAQELISILKKHYSKSGKLYQEIAEKYNGFSYILQEIYYPLKSDIASFNKQSGTIDTTGNFMNDTMNPSFTKALSSNVSNKLQISDVLDTYQHFSEQLATWTQISVKIKQLDRFLNTTITLPNKQSGMKFRQFLNEYVDPDFNKRYESLVLAMQHINKTEKTAVDRILNKIRGINATVSLAFNLKTIAIQPTAYFKYWLYVSPQNWLKALAPNKNLISFKELEKLSPLVYDRYYGNEGRNIAEAQTVGAARALNKFGQVGMELISKTDKIPLKLGWKAIQLEAQSKGITDVNEIVKMFEEATYKTQATYDALSNGSAVRINNEISKSLFMFSSENRKTLSRFFHSIYALSADVKSKKAWKEFAGSTTSMIASAAVVAAITQLLRGLKGDNEEEEVMEGYLKEFTTNMVGVFPIISNLYNSLVNGYDLQLTGFSQITDLLDLPQYCETLMSTSATDADKKHAVIQIAQRLAHAVGVPFRNIYNDIMYVAGVGDKAFNTNMVLELRNLYYNTNKSTMGTLLKTYAKRGDTKKVNAMIQLRFEKYGAGAIDKQSAEEIGRLYMNGNVDILPSSISNEMTYNGETVVLTKAQMNHAQEVYAIANDLLSDMINSNEYIKLTDEEKAKAIKKLYSTYYELAKSDLFSNYESSRLVKVADYVNVSRYVANLAHISSITDNEKMSRKTAVMQYINSLKMSKNEKYLLLLLAGYSISEEYQEDVAKYLKSNGMNYADAKALVGIKE